MRKEESGGMALISITISLLVVAIIIFIALTLYSGGKTGESGAITSPIEKGREVQCISQIRRIEFAVQMYRAENGQNPSTLSALEDLSEDEFSCPVTGSPYNYNPGTGKITCSDHP